ncbi:MAG: hypothetical protein PHY31_06535 [Smithellaceae bacterium]|nr:hypothetical protein [Smithellaceae bacterium]
MKRIVLLMVALAMMIVSIGGCWVDFGFDGWGGRGGGHGEHEGHEGGHR